MHGYPTFPIQQIEILNGILMVVLGWMLLFLALHLFSAWNTARSRLPGGWRNLKATMKIYHANKPEIALTLIVSALYLRTSILWYVRWLRDHHFQESDFITQHASSLLIVFTTLLVIGIACWIRVISPFNGNTAGWIWLAMVGTSLAWGLGMHYLI